MRCQEFEDRMNDLLDQRIPPERDAILLGHAGECPACCRLLNGQAVLFAGMELLETPPLPSRFAATVLEKSESVPSGVFRQRKSKWMAFVGVLASLAAIVVVAVLIDMTSKQPPLNPTAGKPASPPNAAPKVVTVVKKTVPRDQIASTSTAKAVVPPRVSPAIPEQESYQKYQEMINSFTAQLPSAAETIDEVQQSTPAIRPLRASFSMAIGTLQRTIPSRSKKDIRPVKPDSGFFGQWRGTVV